MKPLSLSTKNFTESVIREMTRVCVAAGGVNLSQGFPDWEAPTGIKEAAKKAIDDEFNQYAITHGEPDMRVALAAKVARWNHFQFNPETQVTVTCGSTEAMIASLKAIINPGDEVVIFEPFYENYGPDTILSGADAPVRHPPSPGLDPRPRRAGKAAFNDQDQGRRSSTPPHNPTGKVFSRAKELDRDRRAVPASGTPYAVTDEIYEHIIFDGVEARLHRRPARHGRPDRSPSTPCPRPIP